MNDLSCVSVVETDTVNVSIRILTFEPEGLLPALNLEIQDLADLRPGYASVNTGAFQLELSSTAGRKQWFGPSRAR